MIYKIGDKVYIEKINKIGIIDGFINLEDDILKCRVHLTDGETVYLDFNDLKIIKSEKEEIFLVD